MKFLKLQLEESRKGDWINTCFLNLKSLNINESLEEIKKMPRNKFKHEINQRIRENAFRYLLSKIQQKGKEIEYSEFQMAEYLMPNEANISITDQQYLFAIRNRMINIPSNFGSVSKCVCGQNEDMKHIYNCEKLNQEKESFKFEKIFTGSLKEQVEIMKRFRNNIEIRNKIETNTPCDHSLIL